MTEVRPGQIWRCNEIRADADDVPDAHDDVPLWADYPRFDALVEDVLDGVAELTATNGNSHPRTPAFGATLDINADTLREDPRWIRKGGSR